MGSIKHLKKKVNSLCDNVQNECYVELLFGTSNEVELIWSIMSRCDKLHHEILKKINSKEPKGLPAKDRRAYYKAISDDFYSRTLGLINDMNTIIP